MRLPEITLDDRRFQDLVNEARLRIAQVCPEWTEHNVSDPGVTLIELFAWMTDMLVYRMNRIPDKLHVALLELLGILLEPPTAAHTDIRFRLSAPAQEPVLIPGGATEVGTIRALHEDPIVFQTDDDFTIPPVQPNAYAVERGGQAKDVGVAAGTARPKGADQVPFGTPPKGTAHAALANEVIEIKADHDDCPKGDACPMRGKAEHDECPMGADCPMKAKAQVGDIVTRRTYVAHQRARLKSRT